MTKESGEILSAYMKRVEISQRGLAKKIHIGRDTIRNVVRGDRELSVDQAIKIADALRIKDENHRAEFQLFSAGLTRHQVRRALGREPSTVEQITDVRVRVLRDHSGKRIGKLREYSS